MFESFILFGMACKFGCEARNASAAVVNYCKRVVTPPHAKYRAVGTAGIDYA
jgi:hypothetical protein